MSMFSEITRVYTKVAEKLAQGGVIISCVGIALLTTLVLVEVFLRTLFSVSTMISDEMSGYLLAAIVFLSLGYTLSAKGLIRVDILYSRLRGGLKRAVNWIICLTAFGYALVLTFYLSKYAIYSYSKGVASVYFTATPLYIPQAMVAIGAVLLCLVILSYLLNRAHNIP